MANITKEREARFDETNSQPGGRSGSATPKKQGPATQGGASNSRRPNGGTKGGVFRETRGKVE